MSKLIKAVIFLLVLGGCLAAAGVWYTHRGGDAPSYRTAQVSRGDILVNITATGTVEPDEVVDVGAQVTGRIVQFGTDAAGHVIDYGSEIKQGTLLALIDPTLYQADLDQAQAQLEANKAAVDRSKADLGQMKAKLTQGQRDWDRAQKLGPSDALSQVDYDAYQSAYEVAVANVKVGEASVVQAEKAVAQTQASMVRAKQNVDYCTINAPVDGVVIDRRVNVGQTVVSNLNASSLFLLAKDMNKMEVWVAVNEADIGNIKPGLPVTFSVDAHPGMVFKGVVRKFRLNATMTQNVVTYVVEVETDNAAGLLYPYLTANVSFQLSRHDDVLTVPNAALRWNPKSEQIAPDARASTNSADGSAPTSRPSRRRPTTSESSGAPRRGTLWVQSGEFVKPIQVMLGATDGVSTEVLSAINGGEVKEGMIVVTGEVRDDATASAGGAPGGAQSGNPFMPTMPRGGGRGGAGGGGGGRGGR